jgi:DHA1 family inner membrane transport protein
VGIAAGSFAGGAAVGAFTVSAAVIAGLVLAVIAIPIAWATGLLRPPATEDSAEPRTIHPQSLPAAP